MVYGIFTFCSALLAFIISAVLGKFLIPYLHKLHFGQTILDIGPNWHKDKQGTPIMGGIMFIVAIVVVTLISTITYILTGENFIDMYFADINREAVFIFAGLGLAVANGLIGFIDDYTKAVKKRNLAVLGLAGYGTSTLIPFVGMVDLGLFYYVIAAIVIVGMVNAVNLTDGIDGLNGSVTFFACVIYMLIASMLSYLGITAMSAASAGACLGFLVWNFHPAKVFMGDTGSLFLGGLVCAIAFALNLPVLLLPIGIIYIAEVLSVVLQVSYFKITHGKRLFKMSPIHHHFEMCGWSEVKIVAVFSAITALFGAVAFALVYFGVAAI